MAFAPKHVLMVGATSGIGHAMAVRLATEGSKVTAVGRRQDRLDAFVKENGGGASGEAFDIGEIDKIPSFVEKITKKYPDLDCVFLNAGIQLTHDLANPASFNFKAFTNELDVNYTSFVALTMGFLPFLLTKPSSIVFTGSNLAIVPAATLPGYSASKAALNSFTLALRAQLAATSVKVLEISPPPVQTELHDYMGEDAGRQLGMPLNAFIDQAYGGLAEGKDQVVVGGIGPDFNEIIDKRRAAFENLTKMMSGNK